MSTKRPRSPLASGGDDNDERSAVKAPLAENTPTPSGRGPQASVSPTQPQDTGVVEKKPSSKDEDTDAAADDESVTPQSAETKARAQAEAEAAEADRLEAAGGRPVPAPRWWRTAADTATTLRNAVPHHVIPQLLRPMLVSFLPPKQILVATVQQAAVAIARIAVPPYAFQTRAAEIKRLRRLKSLTALGVNGEATPASDVLAAIAEVPHLKTLQFGHPTASAVDFQLIANALPDLQILNLWDCRELATEGLRHIVTNRTIRHLDLRRCPFVDGDALRVIGEELPELAHLSIVDCPLIDRNDANGYSALPLFRNLERLTLRHSKHQGRNGLNCSLFSHVKTLPLISLEVEGVTDVGPKSLAPLEQVTSLRSLLLRVKERPRPHHVAPYVGALPNLTTLELPESFTGQWTVEATQRLVHGSFASLEKICLSGSDDLQQCLSVLATLPSITHLDIRTSSCPGTCLADIGRMSRLRTLNLSGLTQSTGVFMRPRSVPGELTPLADLHDLTALDLSDNGSIVTTDALSHIAGLTKIRTLDVSRCAASAEALVHLRGMPGLRSLSASSWDISADSMARIGDFSNLTSLSLTACNIPTDAMGQLSRLRKLERLDLSCARSMCVERLQIIAGLRALRWLDLRSCPLGDSGWIAAPGILDAAPCLEEVRPTELRPPRLRL